MKSIVAAVLCAITSLSMLGQSVAQSRSGVASQHSRVGIVSDWTQHRVLYPASKNPAVTARIQKDPRWTQEWYLRHRETWWPRSPHRRLKLSKGVHRDWSVNLGTPGTNIPTFEPLFDFAYETLSPDPGIETGNGSLNTLDELGTVTGYNYYFYSYLATAGTFTMTASGAPISDVGTYPLYPLVPPPAVETLLLPHKLTFDNLLFPTRQEPSAYTAFDMDGNGFLFTGNNGYEQYLSFWGNSGGGCIPPGGAAYDGWNQSVLLDEGGAGGCITVNNDPGGGQTFPAKYTFDVTAAPSCTSDYVAMGIPANAASGGQANIVGYNNLYTNSTGTGYCTSLTGPTVMFAYASGTGEVPASISISPDGTQLAFVEDLLTGSSVFHVLTIGTTPGGEGTSPTDPVIPGSGSSSANDARTVPLSGGSGDCAAQSSTTSPFIDYADNAAYVTTYSWTGAGTGTAGTGTGCLYKISPVFGGETPAIVWSVPLTVVPSSPVWDSVSDNVFFTDSSGNIDYVTDEGSSPSAISSRSVAPGATSENPVTVDSTNHMVYATFNNSGGNAVVVQAPTDLSSSVSVPVGTGNTLFTGPYGVDFNDAFYEPGDYTSPIPLMFVVGNGSGTVPTLYSIVFNGSGVITGVGSSTALATGAIADASAPTEFFNANDTTGGPNGTDYVLVGVTNTCAATATTSSGCVMSLGITNSDTIAGDYPAVTSLTPAYAATGGTTGIIVDNDADINPADTLNYPEASSVYYGTKNGGTLVKLGQNAQY